MRFYGVIGYGVSSETSPGVYEDNIDERPYYGDVIYDSRKLQEGDRVNDDITVQNSISIVADAYANDHFFNIRYVQWQNSKWKVTNVEVRRPRLILRLGGIYNGPTD